MAIKSNTDTVTIDVQLEYNDKQAQKIAQQVDGFQRKQQQFAARHQDKLRQSQETHNQRLQQMEERVQKQAELSAKKNQARLLKGTKTWSQKMVESIKSIRTTIIAMGVAFVSTQVIGGIKQLATESISLAKDLQTLSSQAGISTELLQALAAVYGPLGLGTEQIADTFLELRKAIQEAGVEGGDKVEAFRKLGIAFMDAEGNARSLEEVYNDLVAVSKSMGTNELIGQLDRLGGPIGDNLSKVAENMVTIQEATAASKGKIISEKDLEALNKLNEILENTGRSIRVSISQSMAAVAPELGAALEDIASSLKNVEWGKIVTGLADLTAAMTKLASKENSDRLNQTSKSITGLAKVSPLLGAMAVGLFKLVRAREGNKVLDQMANGITDIKVTKIAKLTQYIKNFSMAITTFTEGAGFWAKAAKTFLSGVKWLGKGIGKISFYISAFFVAWDFFRASMSGLGWLDAAWWTIKKFFADIADLVTFNKWTFGDKLEEQLDKAKKAAEELKNVKSPADSGSDFPDVRSPIPMVAPPTGLIRLDDETRESIRTSAEMQIKIDSIRVATEKANKEFSAWLGMLNSGTITVDEFGRLTADLTNNLNDVNTLAREIITADSLEGFLKPLKETPREIGAIEVGTKRLVVETLEYKLTLEQLNEAIKLHANYALKGFQVLGGALNNVVSIYDSLIQIEQNRLEAQREARQEQIDGLNEEVDALKRLGFANTKWAKRKEAEAAALAKADEENLIGLRKKQQNWAYGGAIINSIESFTKNLATYAWPLGAILGTLSLTTGLAQAEAIKSQKFAKGGMIPGNPYQDQTQILGQGGEFIVNQSATEKNRNLLESINNGASFGGGAQVNVTIQGNVIGTPEFVREHLIPEFQRAIDEGHSLEYA